MSQNKASNSNGSSDSNQPELLGDLLDRYSIPDKGGYITREFQDYGYRLCKELDDEEHKSLYMRLAKNESRVLLEKALQYVKDANARNKAAMFMWKLKQLRLEKKEKNSKGKVDQVEEPSLF